MSEMTEYEFEQFKEQLAIFIKNNFKTCPQFMDGLMECNTDDEIVEHFEDNKDDVYEKLGGDLSDEDEISDLENEVEKLERHIDELENLKIERGGTLEDEYKIQAFEEYRNQFTSWELEELFKNGRKYFNENTNNLGHS
jgi:hypothetical protein